MLVALLKLGGSLYTRDTFFFLDYTLATRATCAKKTACSSCWVCVCICVKNIINVGTFPSETIQALEIVIRVFHMIEMASIDTRMLSIYNCLRQVLHCEAPLIPNTYKHIHAQHTLPYMHTLAYIYTGNKFLVTSSLRYTHTLTYSFCSCCVKAKQTQKQEKKIRNYMWGGWMVSWLTDWLAGS